MSSKDPKQRLQDILDNIDLITIFTQGLTFENYCEDTKTVYAVTRALEIISEASRRLPDDLKQRHDQINWRAIAAAGNIYRHEYENVDNRLIWTTLREELPSLRNVVVTELERTFLQ